MKYTLINSKTGEKHTKNYFKFGKNNDLKKFIMNKFINRLLFIVFTPIPVFVIFLSTILLIPCWLFTGTIIYDRVHKIIEWWWNLKK